METSGNSNNTIFIILILKMLQMEIFFIFQLVLLAHFPNHLTISSISSTRNTNYVSVLAQFDWFLGTHVTEEHLFILNNTFLFKLHTFVYTIYSIMRSMCEWSVIGFSQFIENYLIVFSFS